MRLLVISNRLPITIEINEDTSLTYNRSIGGLATGVSTYLESNKHSSTSLSEYIWIGWTGITNENLSEETKEIIKNQLLEEYHAFPIFLTKDIFTNYYEGFCNKTIWPLFHYFPDKVIYSEEFWLDYKQANEIFCNTILQVVKDDDIIWIHDYQLMLLPQLLRKKLPNISIGFFLHIPFPSYELFETLPKKWVNEILNGLLGSDLIGFHTFDYSQHFLRSVFRTFGHEHTLGQIMLNDRLVKIDTFPMGIDFQKFYNAATSNFLVEQERQQLKEQLSNVKVIFSIDRLDYTKGILHRLQGYEKFLDNNPQWHEKVVLALVVAPSRTGLEDYQLMKQQIDEHVGRINGKFGKIHWSPILYQARSLSFEPLVAFYSISDIALVTPLRDGMNLISKEYIASRTDHTGVLILSMMAGASSELGEAIQINPNNTEEIAEAILEALEMPIEEQISRNLIMQKRLQRYDVIRWANYFIEALINSKKDQDILSSKLLSPMLSKQLIQEFRSSKNRLILLDYDGTLVPFNRNPQKAIPSKELLLLIGQLSTYENTNVALISGRDKETLQNWFGSSNITFLVAEHGVWLKERNADWQLMTTVMNNWKEQVFPILEMYTDRLPGSFIEEKTYSIAWHYRGSDSELSAIRAKELMYTLVNLTGHIGVQILQGNMVIEIRNTGADKGSATNHLITKLSPDFILSIGDDWTDEDMFKVIPKNAYSIKVGASNTYARFIIHSPENVLYLLKQLIQ